MNQLGLEHNQIQTDDYHGVVRIPSDSKNISIINYCGYFPSISTSPARSKFVGWKGIVLHYELN